MKLAINYSPQAASLVKTGELQVEYFKTPNWKWMVDEAKLLRPVAIHFDLEAGNGRLDLIDWDEVDTLARATNTPYINLHLDPKQKHHPGMSVDTLKKSDIKQVTKSMRSDLIYVIDRFGAERVIIENSPYRGVPGNTMRMSIEPDLINRLVEETGCGFLLDISHAIITAHTIGMDTQEYFSRLPIRKIKEMHFAGIHKIKGVWIDHQSILKKNWRWLDWAFKQIESSTWSQPWLLAFEYGGVGKDFESRSNPDVMAEQVPLLVERVNQLNFRIEAKNT